MSQALYERLHDEADRLAGIEQSLTAVALMREAADRLHELDDTIVHALSESDPANPDDVTAALVKGGSITGGAAVLGVSAHRMKRLIIQHRIEWPRGSRA